MVEKLINESGIDKIDIIDKATIEAINARRKKIFNILDWRITNTLANSDINAVKKENKIVEYIRANIDWVNNVEVPTILLKEYLYRYLDILVESFSGVEKEVNWLTDKLVCIDEYKVNACRLCANYYWRVNNIDDAELYIN